MSGYLLNAPGGPLAGTSPWAVAATVLGGTAAVSAGFVALYTRLMALSDRQRAATDFALFQSTSVITAILCGSGGAALAGNEDIHLQVLSAGRAIDQVGQHVVRLHDGQALAHAIGLSTNITSAPSSPRMPSS